MGYTPALEILPPLSVGTSYTFGFQLLGNDGDPLPITDAVIEVVVRRTQSKNSSVILRFRVTVVDETLSLVRLDARKEDTVDLNEGNYFYYATIKQPAGRKDVFFKGTIEFIGAGEV